MGKVIYIDAWKGEQARKRIAEALARLLAAARKLP